MNEAELLKILGNNDDSDDDVLEQIFHDNEPEPEPTKQSEPAPAPVPVPQGGGHEVTRVQDEKCDLVKSKIRAIKEQFSDEPLVASYNISNIDNMNFDDLQEMYNDLKGKALGTSSGGFSKFIYTSGLPVVERLLTDKAGIPVNGMSLNCQNPSNPDYPVIEKSLKLIDIEYFHGIRVTADPLMTLLMCTAKTGYLTMESNKAIRALKERNEHLEEQIKNKN